VKIHSVRGEATTARITGLRPGTGYTFTVRARDAADRLSPPSRSADISTASKPGAAAGTAPTGLKARPAAADGVRRIELSWVPPEVDGEVTEYEIYLNGEFATTVAWGVRPPRGRTTYTLDVVDQPRGSHRVKLRARLPDGTWGSFSAVRTVTFDAGQ
jgi:hypothetical protein